jgi:hypothetical protein
MRIELTDVTKGRRGEALPPTSLVFETGGATLAVAETEQRPAVLGLVASGRMRPDAGTIAIDGSHGSADIRRRVALVDALDVCDPAPNVSVLGVAGEELMFAGRPAHPLAARRWLAENGFASLASTPIADVAPRERIRMLMELTALRRGVEGLVLVSPDRHGGEPAEWWDVAVDFAARGFAVLVIAGAASATVLADRLTPAESGRPESDGPENDGPEHPAPDPTEPDSSADTDDSGSNPVGENVDEPETPGPVEPVFTASGVEPRQDPEPDAVVDGEQTDAVVDGEEQP